ncbi:hypothetical protein [Streptomyces broussonetiae]|uniref:hypothetical protein n=1 Tax=Streptomyces broussonetiae TaxID=2686304 RepID=UPI0035D7CA18
MSDRTSGSGDERRAGRFAPRPDEDRTPEDAPAGYRAPRVARPEDRLPGGPPPPPSPPPSPARAASRLPGSTGPGREGLTADDRTPRDAPPHPPGPAGTGKPGEGRMSGGRGMPAERVTPYRARTPDESPMPEDGLGVPSSGEASTREAHGSESPDPDAWPTAPGGPTAGAAPAAGAPLLSHDETDRWERRMQELAAGFAAEPRRAVEAADRALEEIVGRCDEAVAGRRRTLRRSWEACGDRGPGTQTGTEQLRLALRDYQELADRLLHL